MGLRFRIILVRQSVFCRFQRELQELRATQAPEVFTAQVFIEQQRRQEVTTDRAPSLNEGSSHHTADTQSAVD